MTLTKTLNLLGRRLAFTRRIAVALMVGLFISSSATAASFSEPHTVFYGKILGTGSAQDFLVTEGDLTWTILRSDGEEVTLNSSLYEWNDGQFSYRLDIPHSAFALGLDDDAGGIPMPPTPSLHLHASISVDGEPAMLLGPAGSVFSTEQLTRTSTYRLDLALGRTAVDTDGDGIADWWEDLFGLDKQDPSDASSDLSGDGLSALDAYLRGLDPTMDNRMPMLLTKELLVYPAGSTAILLDTADLDSTADQIVYTLTELPLTGTLTLRNVHENALNPDEELSVGTTFSQADLLKGRLVYDQLDPSATPGTLKVTVGDENTGHTSEEAEVQLLAFVTPPALPETLSVIEAQRIANAFYAAEGRVIMDASDLPGDVAIANPSAGLTSLGLADYLSVFGDDRPYVFISAASDTILLQGGLEDDVLVAGEGDGSLTGAQGADRFAFSSLLTGNIVIEDFSSADGDIIDLSNIPAMADTFVNAYLRLTLNEGEYRLELDASGTGAAFTNLMVALPGLTAGEADLYGLIEAGRIDVGNLDLQPRVTVATTNPQASENGPTAGTFTLFRQGSLAGDLTVELTWSGAAVNGTDYELAPSTVLLPAGESQVELSIVPYMDGVTEPAETVSVVASAGNGYIVGTSSQASLTIEDLLMLVTIEALEPMAVVDPMASGLFVISRRDVIDRSVIIYLTISGTAAGGTDYETITPYIQMGANQTDALISVTPKPGAILDGGVETVRVSVQPRSAYRTSGDASARVVMIGQEDSFDDWRVREFPGSVGESAEEFAASSTGESSISHLERYAFGLDPHAPGSVGLPQPMVVDGRLVVTFRKPMNISGISYQVRGAQTVEGLNQAPPSMTELSMPEDDVNPERVYYQIHEDAQDSSTAFGLIEVEWQP